MIVVFIFFIASGQGIVALGMYLSNFPLMIFGRFVFGIGGESLGISTNTLIINWF